VRIADGSGNPRREPVRQEFRDERSRDDHALVDVEPELAEPRLACEVRGRDARVDPPREELAELRALVLRETGVEEHLEAVERQR
jgi:hypothetical protein